MRKVKQLSRRSFLMSAGKGVFGVLSEVQFGVASKGLVIALGGSTLATACSSQPAATSAPAAISAEAQTASYLRVITQFVNAYVLVRGQEIAIVDTGLPHNADKFADVIQTAGLGWDAVNHIVITHLHPDHIGGLGEVAAEASQATIYAGAADIAGIDSPRTIQALHDGDEVFGMQIIGTPGHTPGHISVYDPNGSFFVAGDAINNVNGELTGPNPQFTPDMATANESVKKIATLTFEAALFGHGEPLESGASTAIAELAGTLKS